ncbi:SAF domain-containing protein [Kitasatospora sp. NBC_00240]|uniref:SAF domain-containing protein n=1 Tax=Kitasatospora sp. NBC_00240 TaxID=2903567 RepID=UPI002257831B|nr:SAF domain-containing protein [Kitasatospora sp. NBC_00240]MCX5215693.1 SAF domain-containing protein [Kitasatospora sp. NBC_00240]
MARSSTRSRTSAPEDTKQQPVAALPITESAPRRSRRPAFVAVGIALAAVGGLGAAYAVNQAGDRVSVIAVKQDIPAGKVITSSDLVAAEVVADPALHPVPVTRSHDILGKVAAADLPAGTLVTDGSVRGGQPITSGKDTVGVLAKAGQLPAGNLQPGDAVTVVATPRQDDDKPATQPATITAVIVRIGDPDANGARVVDLAVSPVDSPALASWASTGRVAIVLKAKG